MSPPLRRGGDRDLSVSSSSSICDVGSSRSSSSKQIKLVSMSPLIFSWLNNLMMRACGGISSTTPITSCRLCSSSSGHSNRGEQLSAEKPLPFILLKSVGEKKTLFTLSFAKNVSSKRDQELPPKSRKLNYVLYAFTFTISLLHLRLGGREDTRISLVQL